MNLINTVGLFLSLWIGIAAILAAWQTVKHYGPHARAFFASAKNRTMTGWLMTGIALGFLGAFIDSAYWQVFWVLEYFQLSAADPMQSYGIWSVAIFRNGFLLVSAYCHYRAYLIAAPETDGPQANRFVLKTLGVGAVVALAMLGLPWPS
jgi:cell division protein FtsX